MSAICCSVFGGDVRPTSGFRSRSVAPAAGQQQRRGQVLAAAVRRNLQASRRSWCRRQRTTPASLSPSPIRPRWSSRRRSECCCPSCRQRPRTCNGNSDRDDFASRCRCAAVHSLHLPNRIRLGHASTRSAQTRCRRASSRSVTLRSLAHSLRHPPPVIDRAFHVPLGAQVNRAKQTLSLCRHEQIMTIRAPQDPVTEHLAHGCFPAHAAAWTCPRRAEVNRLDPLPCERSECGSSELSSERPHVVRIEDAQGREPSAAYSRSALSLQVK